MANLKYVNHLNQTVDLRDKNHFIDSYELKNYSWNYSSDFNKIKNFNRTGITSKKLSLYVRGKNTSEAFELYNQLFETFEIDVLAGIPGKFYMGDYYYICYVPESSKTTISSGELCIKFDFTTVSDTNTWIKETTYSFSKNQLVSGHGYVYGYPYNYASSANKSFLNDSLADSNFKLTIYGGASNPAVSLGGHLYSVETGIESNEYLEIDSKNKTVQKILENGTRVSVLEFRDRDNYIFKKVPTGIVSVGWNNSFGFDVTIFDERSEPKWN